MIVINQKELERRYAILEADMKNTFNKHNSLLDQHFDKISYLSSVLPNYLSQITTLADMVTDAIVIAGRSKLSKLASELPVVSSKGIKYKSEVNSLELATVAENTYTINSRTSYILTPNDYTVFNKDKTAISSLEQLLHRGDGIVLETTQSSSKYTLVLELGGVSKINSLAISLALTTESYPLISEIYYINNENKKVNCFILNTLSNKFDMDLNRVAGNNYELSLLPIETKRLYITFEDTAKEKLGISNISIKKVKHEATGSIVFGPLVSTNPILKTSIESSGNIEGARYYVSTDLNTWREILTPSQIDLVSGKSKILSFNTVNSNSIQLAQDVKKLYLKVDLTALPVKGGTSAVTIMKEGFTTTAKNISSAYTVGNVSVYKDTYNLVYGIPKREVNLNAFRIMDKNITKISYNNTYKIKGFIESESSYSDNSQEILSECLVEASPLKRGGEGVLINDIDPKSSTLYGYSLTKNTKKEFNRDTATNIVLKLKDTFTKDIYSVRQGQKEILVNLELGYITSCIDVVYIVEDTKPVTLYNSIGTKILDLTVSTITGTSTKFVSLEEMFELPTSAGLTLNTLYPVILNTSKDFSILNSEVKASDKLITLSNTYTLNKESIKTTIKVSKENPNLLVVSELNILEQYLNKESEVIPAFSKSRAIKLKNKDIKKGSLSIERADKPYLVEVVYNNGVDEFKTYRTSALESIVTTPKEFVTSVRVAITDPIDDYSTLQVSIKGRYETPVYFRKVDGGEEGDLEFYTGDSDYFLDGDILEILYLSLSENPSNLYSVNYEDGVVYLSAVMNSDLIVLYAYYNTLVTGLKADQLKTEDYQYESNTINIVNAETNISYLAVYEVITTLTPQTTTPFITNTKINYINTRDEESLP